MALPRKDETQELPVPSPWRGTFQEIVSSFVRGDFGLSCAVANVRPVPTATAKHIEAYVGDYGETLVELPDAAWDSSVARWMGSYWDVLVDLWTEAEGRSDLVLSARVYEAEEGYSFEVNMVYVP